MIFLMVFLVLVALAIDLDGQRLHHGPSVEERRLLDFERDQERRFRRDFHLD